MLSRNDCFYCGYSQTFVADLVDVESADTEARPNMYSEMLLSVKRPFQTQTHGQHPSRLSGHWLRVAPFAGCPVVGSNGAEVLWLPQPPEVPDALKLSLPTS